MADEAGRTQSSAGPKIAVALVLLAVAGVAGWLLLKRAPEPAPVVMEQVALDAGAPPPRDPSLPPLRESDAWVRERMAGISADPGFAAWLGMDDLVGRFAATVSNVAEGTSPRRQLPALAPKTPFTSIEKAGKEHASPASFAHYDATAAIVSTIDASAAATAYGLVKPLVVEAYRALGYPTGDFDAVFAKAMSRIVNAPIVEGELELTSKGAIWLFADPKLEALPEPEKHLLRMGAKNARLVQAKARELANAIGLPLAPP